MVEGGASGCIPEAELSRFVSGALEASRRDAILAHLAGCDACRHLVAVLASEAPPTAGTTPTLDGASPFPEPELSPGDVIGRYQLLERVGRGGMGVVFAAFDRSLQRKVALKLLVKRLGEAELTTRLSREAQAMAQLQHPNVVTVHDVGADSGRLFIAMELVTGTTLRQWLRDEPRPWRLVLEKMIAAGSGLAAAHRVGLVHRDFKLDNVLLGEDGVARVTDFGLAKWAGTEGDERPTDLHGALGANLTRTGTIAGSAGYMAPELVYEGASTEKGDQFSFCVSLYEALVGTRPFAGATLAELAHHSRSGIYAPAPAAKGVPRWVMKHLRRGLAGDPRERHESMDALLERLRADPWPRRRRWLAVAGIVSLVAVTALAAWRQKRVACLGFDGRLSTVWSAEAIAQRKGAFLATGIRSAEADWSRVEHLLSEASHGWIGMRTEVCRERVEGLVLPKDDELRVECLEERRRELEALAGTLAHADKRVLVNAYAAVSGLRSTAPCRNVSALANPRRVVAAAHVTEVAALRERLSEARTALLVGDAAHALEHARPVLARAKETGPQVLVAESALIAGDAMASLGIDEHLATFEEGLRAATAVGEDELALELIARVITARGYDHRRPEEAHTLLPVAFGIASRLEASPAAGRLWEAVANVEWEQAEYARAFEACREALGRLHRRPEDRSLDIARLLTTMGWVLTDLDRLDEAAQTLDRAAQMTEALVGTEHATMVEVWRARANLAAQRGDERAAVEAHGRILHLLEALWGPEDRQLFTPSLNAARAAALTGDDADARRHHARAEALSKGAPEPYDECILQHRRAVIELWSGHPLDAITAARRALSAPHPKRLEVMSLEALAEAQVAAGQFDAALETTTAGLATGPQSPRWFNGLRGRALAGLGRHQEAIDVLQGALAEWPSTLDPVEKGFASLAFAEALWGRGRRDEAKAEAERARDLLAHSGLTRVRASVDDWLAKTVR